MWRGDESLKSNNQIKVNYNTSFEQNRDIYMKSWVNFMDAKDY